MQFYPVNALAEAGAHVDTFANWHPNVVVDRELITGQQPMSAEEFGNTLISKLNGSSTKRITDSSRNDEAGMEGD